jgi:hypothetical protein
MKRIALALVALGGLTALTVSGAIAAPSGASVHFTRPQPMVTEVDYYWHHHHWHHHHWEHHHWRYYD